VAALTAVGFFADRLKGGLQRDARQLLGGDAVVSSDRPTPQAFLDQARAIGLKTSTAITFPTMGRAEDSRGGASKLVALKVVDAAYPLRGQLTVANAPDTPGARTRDVPAPGEVWVDPQVLDGLALGVGDTLLLGDRWPSAYHVTPEGFSRAATKAQAEAIAAADAAMAAGLTVLTAAQAETARNMAAALRRNAFATAALSNGEPEMTLAWIDKETGVWCRARPDFLPHKRRIIPDVKTAADASPEGFSKAISTYGYHIAAAHYMAGIEAIYGERPAHWIHVVIESAAPFDTPIYELPAEDIEIREDIRRRALRTFADCLNADKWPGYATDVASVGLTSWARKSHSLLLEKESA
jgi:hypothetical protein